MFIIITLINITIIATDITLATADKSNNSYDIAKKVFSLLSSICISIFSIAVTLNNIYDKQLSSCQMFKKLILNIIDNFRNDEILTKTKTIVKKVDEILIAYGTKVSKEAKTIAELGNFKNIVKKNLLYRLSIGNYIKLITIVFFYFNAVLFVIPILNTTNDKIILIGNSTSSDSEIVTKKVVIIFMNVVNQILSVLFSYLSVVCNNMIFLSHLCDTIHLEISKSINDKTILEFLEDSSGYISNPLSIIWKKRTDLMKEKESALGKSMKTTIFGSPVSVINAK